MKKPENAMEIRRHTLRFLTPAFIGGADQSAQWRTPPIKHLLREWWRVAWSRRHGFPNDFVAMRQAEGHLFGVAADGERGGSRRSQVILRLGEWRPGNRKNWVTDEPRVFHGEVGEKGMQVGAHLYLGYGPLQYDKNSRKTTLHRPPAIDAGEAVELRLAFPKEAAEILDEALWLAHRYGSLGGRSRNGWGSFVLEGLDAPQEEAPVRDWRDCLDRDYPHAIGQDEQGPLVWATKPHDDWSALQRTLAEIKIDFRTRLPLRQGKNAPRPEARHWLAYPVTHHSVRGWGNYRLPNSLRMRVREEGAGKLVGILYHMPICPPEKARPEYRTAIERAWETVHQVLDARKDLRRVPA